MSPYQPALFDLPAAPLKVTLFHDASGTYGQDRWLTWGFLFCRKESESVIFDMLQEARQAEKCWSPLHFADLPGSWGGKGKHKPRTVYRWLEAARLALASDIWFHTFALDARSPGFKAENFPRKFHLHNRFCRMGLMSAIPWFFKGVHKICIRAFFHRQTFEGIRMEEAGRAGVDYDNLGDYIISQTVKEARDRNHSQPNLWPRVEFEGSVRFISIDPQDEAPAYQAKCELLQLADIILGAVSQAIDGASRRKTKRELASIVGEWAADVRKEPWEQKLGLHRRFSVSYFPGARGDAYSDGPLKLSSRLPGARQRQLGI